MRADDVYALMAQEQLYVDLSAVPLAQPWRVMLYLNQQVQEAYGQTLEAATASNFFLELSRSSSTNAQHFSAVGRTTLDVS